MTGVAAVRVAITLTILVLTGCAAYVPPPATDRTPAPPPPPIDEAPAPETLPPPVAPAPAPTPEPEPPRQDPATLALLGQSQRAVEAGNVDEAIAYVERALRMNGQDVELWLRLAELQLLAARPANAEQLAQRAIVMAGSRADWQRRGWLIVADAREARGDREEAERIRFQWRSYRG